MKDRTRVREAPRELPRFACLRCGDAIATDVALRRVRGHSNAYHDGCGGAIAQLAPELERATSG